MRTFFSSSSSSFHFAPRSLPISPVRRVNDVFMMPTTNERTHRTQHRGSQP